MIKDIDIDAQKITAAISLGTRLIADDFASEKAKKSLLHDLAELNAMVPKGYMVTHSSADDLVYAIKQVACEYISTHWAKRCTYYSGYGPHDSVLYVYAAGRQYSYHVTLSGTTLKQAKFGEWDRIEKGWSLTDTDYKKETAERRRCMVFDTVKSTQTQEFNDALLYLKAAKEYRNNRKIRLGFKGDPKEKFWGLLDQSLPKKIRDRKYYREHNFYECYSRYFAAIESNFTATEKWLLLSKSNFGAAMDNLPKNRNWETQNMIVEIIVSRLDSGTLTYSDLTFLVEKAQCIRLMHSMEVPYKQER